MVCNNNSWMHSHKTALIVHFSGGIGSQKFWLETWQILDLKIDQLCCFYSRLSWFMATMTGVKDKYLSSSIFILDLQEHIDFVWVKPTLTKSRANNICGGKRENKNKRKASLLLIMNSSVWKVSVEKARDEKQLWAVVINLTDFLGAANFVFKQVGG